MRHFISLLLVPIIAIAFIGCATTLPPAGPSEEPMENADVIWIHTNDEPQEAYKRIGQLISDEGYSISSSDESLMNISTDYKQLEQNFGDAFAGINTSISINASIREEDQTAIKLTAKAQFSGASNDSDVEVKNEGPNRNAIQRGWQELDQIAESYPDGELNYTRNQ